MNKHEEAARTVLQHFYAYFDKLVRRGTCSRLDGTDVAILEIFSEWLGKHYVIEKITKRTKPK